MSDLDARLDLAKSLFGGMPSQSTNTVKGTVMSDSSSGSVSVKIGEVEYDDDGNIIVPESDLIATIPIIGSASTGDEVTVIVEDGSPTAIAAPGWGDNIKANLQYMTFEPSGTYAGLHIHEDATDYNTDGDLWLNSGAIELRDNGSMIAEFAGDSVQILGGRAVFGASTPHLLTIGADDADVSVGAYENGTIGGEIYLRQPIYNSNQKGSIVLRNSQASGQDYDDSINAWLRVVLFNELCDNYGNPGTNGQVLTSQGSGQPPIWSTVQGGGGGGSGLAWTKLAETSGNASASLDLSAYSTVLIVADVLRNGAHHFFSVVVPKTAISSTAAEYKLGGYVGANASTSGGAWASMSLTSFAGVGSYINNTSFLTATTWTVYGATAGTATGAMTLTLPSSGWSGNSQTVTATGVNASSNVIVSPAPADAADWASAGILCTAQGADSLTFTCTTAPSSNLTANVLIV